MPMYKFIAPVLAVFLFITPLWAGETAEKPAPNPVIEAYQDFTKDLGEKESRHFSVLYGNYNLVKVVETVRESVDEAINKCGKENPDMKNDLQARFKAWKAEIKPVLKEANANINNMVFAQDYAKPKKIKKFFKLIDKSRKKQNKDVEKVPVTTPEACTYLLEQMDSTQENMLKLLRTTLISLPQAMQAQDKQAEEEEKKAQQAALEKEKAEKAKEEAE